MIPQETTALHTVLQRPYTLWMLAATRAGSDLKYVTVRAPIVPHQYVPRRR